MVPHAIREAALGLGIPEWRSTLQVTLRTASAGVITGVMLAFARVAGETAPLLFTAFGNQFWSLDPSQAIAALPLQIFVYASSPFDEWHRQAWAGALILILLIVLAVAAVLLCAIVLVVGLIRGQPAELMVITAISLVVAAVPESLPAVVTLALALGARRMAARHALIRRLPAVETLGSVTVLGTDKTGTLTEGNMVARHLWTPLGEVTISGTGYGPAGEVTRNGQPVKPGDAPDLTALLTAAVACNDAAIHRPEESGEPWTAVGDPTEAALLSAAAKFGLSQAEVNAGLPRYAEIPFESGRKRMTTVHRLADGGARIICKGAPEAMLSRPVLDGDPAALRLAADRAEEFARDGFRVLAVATADRPPGEAPAAVPAAPAPERGRPGIATAGLDADGPEPAAPGTAAPGTAAPGTGSPGHPPAGTATAAELELERGLRLLGLIAILDPPRPSAAATIAACQAAGIVPVLITGDHPATARSIATELGIIEPGEPVVDCRGTAADGDRGEATARVFARATPEQKLAVIQARRAAGDVVAMTGDGVNDGPALRRADIGVAMGRRGTEVARQAADLVLADDELRTVVAAAEEGRRVYANIRRFLLYGLSGGSAEIAVMLAGPALGMPLPLLPAQILWVNLLTHGLPGVALGSEPAAPGAMKRPPRPPAESVLGAGLWQRIVRVGLVVAGVTLGVAGRGPATRPPPPRPARLPLVAPPPPKPPWPPTWPATTAASGITSSARGPGPRRRPPRTVPTPAAATRRAVPLPPVCAPSADPGCGLEGTAESSSARLRLLNDGSRLTGTGDSTVGPACSVAYRGLRPASMLAEGVGRRQPPARFRARLSRSRRQSQRAKATGIARSRRSTPWSSLPASAATKRRAMKTFWPTRLSTLGRLIARRYPSWLYRQSARRMEASSSSLRCRTTAEGS